jgi:hypothetical protein
MKKFTTIALSAVVAFFGATASAQLPGYPDGDPNNWQTSTLYVTVQVNPIVEVKPRDAQEAIIEVTDYGFNLGSTNAVDVGLRYIANVAAQLSVTLENDITPDAGLILHVWNPGDVVGPWTAANSGAVHRVYRNTGFGSVGGSDLITPGGTVDLVNLNLPAVGAQTDIPVWAQGFADGTATPGNDLMAEFTWTIAAL